MPYKCEKIPINDEPVIKYRYFLIIYDYRTLVSSLTSLFAKGVTGFCRGSS